MKVGDLVRLLRDYDEDDVLAFCPIGADKGVPVLSHAWTRMTETTSGDLVPPNSPDEPTVPVCLLMGTPDPIQLNRS